MNSALQTKLPSTHPSTIPLAIPLLNESNFAFISVGLTAYETIFFNTPAMFIPIKKIDIKLAKYFETLKLGVSTPYFKNLNYSILKNKLKNLTNNKKIILHKKKLLMARD